VTEENTKQVDYSGGPWVYLIWLGFLMLPLQRDQPLVWYATGGAVAVFLALYFWGFHKTGPQLWASRFSLFPYNGFAHTFFMYAGIPGASAKTRESAAIIGLTLLGSYIYFTWQHMDSLYFGLVSIVGGGRRSSDRSRKTGAAARGRRKIFH
jgi:hypothetical protein